jgi:ribonucleotide reductase alpha subunit
VSPHELAKGLFGQLEDNMKTSDIDTLCAEHAYSMYTTHPDYGILAARVLVSAMHKDHRTAFAPTTEEEKRAKKKRGTFAALVERIEAAGVKAGRGVYNPTFLASVRKNGAAYEAMLDHSADYKFTFFALRTLANGYLLKGGGVQELPQHLWMRVAVGFHGSDLPRVKETYELLRDLKNIYGTPTELNMGLTLQQLASCFLTGIHRDSIKGIYKTVAQCADISKTAGGIGMHIHEIRNAGAPILGTGGESSGIVPMLRQFNEVARYVDQGGNKRPGAIAVYAEPHMLEIRKFINLRKNHGDENLRARDLFLALWLSDLFMERVKAKANWSLFCPKAAPGLSDVWGNAYTELYERYEREGRAGAVIDAQDLWFAILDSQIETGTPYLLNKDACNRKSNHQHLGTIKCSNLCTEIVEYTSKDETAVCNLSSICLPRFLNKEGTEVDHAALHAATKVVTRNLSKVIDINVYPVIEAGRSNRRHRPVGLGVQGLDDLYKVLGLPFDSQEALTINAAVFETMYHASTEMGCELAQERKDAMLELRKAHADGEWEFGELKLLPPEVPGDEPESDPNYLYNYTVPSPRLNYLLAARRTYLQDLLEQIKPIPEELALPEEWAGAYSSFAGSPMSKGVLQLDMWDGPIISGRWDWDALRAKVVAGGTRLSLTMAPMPTASTSQIEGNNEAFEPRTANIYARRTGAGEFVVMNEVLVRKLIEMGKWSETTLNSIIGNKGSVQQLDIPLEMKRLHRTAWELSMKSVIDQARARAPYVDQSMSMNLWQEEPSYASLSAMHFYAWSQGLKTLMYYLRTRALAQAQQVTVPVKKEQEGGGGSGGGGGAGAGSEERSGEAELPPLAAMLACARDNPGACDMCSS